MLRARLLERVRNERVAAEHDADVLLGRVLRLDLRVHRVPVRASYYEHARELKGWSWYTASSNNTSGKSAIVYEASLCMQGTGETPLLKSSFRGNS